MRYGLNDPDSPNYVADLEKRIALLAELQAFLSTLKDAHIEGWLPCDCGCKYWESLRCVSCGAPVADQGEQLAAAVLGVIA